jgi:hypothetical protein
LLFNNIGFFAVEPNLMAALIELSVFLDHRVVTIGNSVIESVANPVVFHHVLQAWAIRGMAHSGELKGPGYVSMAAGTNSRVNVLRVHGPGALRSLHLAKHDYQA